MIPCLLTLTDLLNALHKFVTHQLSFLLM